MPEISSLTLSANPVAYYKLEADGNDETANNNDLTVTGTPTFGAAKFGNGVTIDADTKHLAKVTGCANLPTGTGNLSIVAWLKRVGTLTATSAGYIAFGASTDGSNLACITAGSANNTVRLGTFAGGTGSFGSDVAVSTTATMVGFTRSATGVTFKSYLNGALVATDTVTARNIGSAVTVRLGESYPGVWNLQFDDAAIFAAALTDADMALINGAGPKGLALLGVG